MQHGRTDSPTHRETETMTTPDLSVEPKQQPVRHQASQQPRRPARPSPAVRPLLSSDTRIAVGSSSPWWFRIPAVVAACFKVAMAPLHLVVLASELVMAALVLGIAGTIGAWWLGWITDAQILAVAKPLGDRLMAIIQSLGYL